MIGRVGRWALKLMEFQYTIKHKQGRLHVVPDCLSRDPCRECDVQDEEKTNAITMLAMNVRDNQQLQQEDEDCRRILEAVKNPEKASSADRRLERSFTIEDSVLYRKNVAHLGPDKLLVVPKVGRKYYSSATTVLLQGHTWVLAGHFLRSKAVTTGRKCSRTQETMSKAAQISRLEKVLSKHPQGGCNRYLLGSRRTE